MVKTDNVVPNEIGNPERFMIVSYARAPVRSALAALLALDDKLGDILRTTREPMLGKMRLAWWHDALVQLDCGAPPDEPVLQALARKTLPSGVRGVDLAAWTEAWDSLLEEQIDEEALDQFGATRGGLLFSAAGVVLGASAADPLPTAGKGWALADLSLHLSDPAAQARARSLAAPLLQTATHARWSRAARPLGAMAHLAQMDLADVRSAPGAPRRVGRALWHRLTGR